MDTPIRYLLLSLLIAALAVSTAMTQVDKCLECHQSFEDETDGPSHKITRDVHFEKGMSCVDCHGGDRTLTDMDEVRRVKDYRGVPTHLEVPDFCARCHSDAVYMRNHNPALPTDQLAKYKTSVHGQRLFGNKDAKVANCVSCHGVHDINNAKLPHSSTNPLNLPGTCAHCHADAEYMAEYGIDTDQYADYVQSVHGKALLERKDLGAPACNDCHSNHGAAPPGVENLTFVCGNCHALQEALFEVSPHYPAFQQNDLPMCVTCHGNHLVEPPTDSLVGDHAPAYCINCHAEDDGTKGLATARGVAQALAAFVSARDSAETVLAEASRRGMMTTDEEFALKEVAQLLIQTRTQVHAFNLDSLAPKADEGIKKADQVRLSATALIDEYNFRRQGLALATVFMVLLIVGLYLRLRKIEKKS